MLSLKTILIIAGFIYYLYSGLKDKDAQKNKKTPSNPTPAQKTSMEELLEKMMEQQRKTQKENQPEFPPPVSGKKIFREAATVKKNEKQGLPFEKRKRHDSSVMPSQKQIEKVIQREKKATQHPEIKVKDYDEDIINHDQAHPSHALGSKSNIKFHFGTEEEESSMAFDARQAIIAQVILERKHF